MLIKFKNIYLLLKIFFKVFREMRLDLYYEKW